MKKLSESVSYDVNDGVAVLISDNPPVNAMSYHVRQGLVDGVEMAESDDDVQDVAFDKVLIVLGRRANTQGLGLEDLGVPLNQNGTVEVNEFLQCVYPNIFACGDVAGPFQLTHASAHQAWYCTMNALFRKLKRTRSNMAISS